MKLSYEEIEAKASQIDQEAGNIEGVLNDIKGYFESIGPGSNCFRGEAADKVRAQFDSFTEVFAKCVQAIRDEATYVTTAVSNYRQTDEAVTSAISGSGSC